MIAAYEKQLQELRDRMAQMAKDHAEARHRPPSAVSPSHISLSRAVPAGQSVAGACFTRLDRLQ